MSAPRPEWTLEAQPTKGLGGKEPNMLIIDSLLMSKSFLSRRGAENPLSFSGRSSASSHRIDRQMRRAQPRTVVRLIGAEHGKQSMQQFPHDSHDRLQPSFASS